MFIEQLLKESPVSEAERKNQIETEMQISIVTIVQSDSVGGNRGIPQSFHHARLHCRERNCLLKEAEVLHKARFNHIIQIFGVCNEPEFFCIVTEFMTNGSLDELLHEVMSVFP